MSKSILVAFLFTFNSSSAEQSLGDSLALSPKFCCASNLLVYLNDLLPSTYDSVFWINWLLPSVVFSLIDLYHAIPSIWQFFCSTNVTIYAIVFCFSSDLCVWRRWCLRLPITVHRIPIQFPCSSWTFFHRLDLQHNQTMHFHLKCSAYTSKNTYFLTRGNFFI